MGARHSLTIAAIAIMGVGCAALRPVHSITDPVLYPEPRQNAITFWGHACAYIDVGGYGIVTDPVFRGRYATIRRRLIPAPPEDAYDQTRLVLISHAHQDHLDPATLRQFPRGVVILAPVPAARYLLRRGIRARVMRPGQEYAFPGGSVIAVTAHHPGGRLSLRARSDGRALGYVIRTMKGTIYYSGDTEYFPGFTTVGMRYRPDIAILNVNAHLRSPEAIFAVADLGMPVVLPIHFGAYDGKSTRRGPEWRGELAEALGPIVVPLEVGQSYPLANIAAERRVRP